MLLHGLLGGVCVICKAVKTVRHKQNNFYQLRKRLYKVYSIFIKYQAKNTIGQKIRTNGSGGEAQ